MCICGWLGVCHAELVFFPIPVISRLLGSVEHLWGSLNVCRAVNNFIRPWNNLREMLSVVDRMRR